MQDHAEPLGPLRFLGQFEPGPGAPDALMARRIRCVIVASGTRNAAAISAVVKPPTARSVSASCDGGDSAGAFSESLRQEVARRYVRVCLVEPGATATELASHNRPEVLESIRSQFGQRMEAGDIPDAVTYVVTRPRHVAVNEMLIRPTEQER